ncbi:MAG: Na(+)-translocating NADH-quinone reductase subunit A [Candidatus Dadabacteria bacterium]|nr:MAG: Na(+)-translocating NADH-quinone reductase subunit A [Candidatus Dadabacteria bacterium]
MIKIKRGLDIPIAGRPRPVIEDGAEVRRVALIGPDYHGLRPTLQVAEGDSVRLGQTLFVDKKRPDIRFTSPGTGKVLAVNRGLKRRLLSVEIELDGSDDQETFSTLDPATSSAEQLEALLLESGMWTAFRTRPFSKVPDPGSRPAAIFVAAMDTNPLALDPVPIIRDRADDFQAGLTALTRLTSGPVYVTKQADTWVPGVDVDGVRVVSFDGPHPAGLVGTHIHYLEPVGQHRTVWTIGYQDVLALATLLREGRLETTRIVAFGGPQVRDPRYLRTRLGASLSDLTADELREGPTRVVSGSVLSGRLSIAPIDYLGRYHTQVSAISDRVEHELLGWLALSGGKDKFSALNIYLDRLLDPEREYELTTDTHGSPRAMIPLSVYDDVWPLDILISPLLRAILVGDTDTAIELGVLDLDEEDLALCTFVCPSKNDYGPILRKNLAEIEREW